MFLFLIYLIEENQHVKRSSNMPIQLKPLVSKLIFLTTSSQCFPFFFLVALVPVYTAESQSRIKSERVFKDT